MVTADAVLVLRSQEEDLDAFDEIVARYKDGIYNYIWRMIANRDDVEDLTQEVFVRAFASIKSFRREANLRTWLYRIAANVCVDRYRRRGIEKRYTTPLTRDNGEETEQIELPDTDSDPQVLYARTELAGEVQRAILKLPDKQRSVILLYDMEGMSYDEIAEIEGCPLGTVKSRLFKARVQLRTLLAPYMEIS